MTHAAMFLPSSLSLKIFIYDTFPQATETRLGVPPIYPYSVMALTPLEKAPDCFTLCPSLGQKLGSLRHSIAPARGGTLKILMQ